MVQADTSIYNNIAPPEQPSVLDIVSKSRNMIAQQQAQQQNLQVGAEKLKQDQLQNAKAAKDAQDEELSTKALVEANGDPQKTMELMLQGGVGPRAFRAAQDHFAAIAEHTAKTDAENLKVMEAKNNEVLGLHDSALSLSPDQLTAAWPGMFQRLAQIDPKATAGLDPNTPPTDDQIIQSRAMHQTLDYNLKAEAEKRAQQKAREEAAKAARDAALAPSVLKKAEGEAAQNTVDPATQLTPNETRQAQQAKDTLNKPPALVPGRDVPLPPAVAAQRTAIANASRAPQGPATSTLPGLENVPAHLAAPAAAAYSKSAVAYADAKSTADEIQSVIDLVRSGNKAAGSNLPLLGVGALNAINGIKRMNSAEINQYQGAGSLLDRITGEVGSLAAGQPIPASVLDDIEQLHKKLGDGAIKKHTAEVQAINASHGSTFKPIQIGGSSGGKFKAGDSRVINGKKVIRDENGNWN